MAGIWAARLRAAATAALVVAAANAARAETAAGRSAVRLDLAASVSADAAFGRALADFAREASADSAGALQIAPHMSGALFDGREVVGAARRGATALGARALALVEPADPVFTLGGLPYVAADLASARLLYDAQRPLLESRFLQLGLTFLFAAPSAPPGLFLTEPAEPLSDLQGRAVAVEGPAGGRLAAALGMAAVALEPAEMPEALRVGAVSGVLVSAEAAAARRIGVRARYWWRLEASRPKLVVFANRAAFDALPGPARAALSAAADNAERRLWSNAAAEADAATNALTDMGVVAAAPPAEAQEAIRIAGREARAEWRETAYPDALAVLTRYAPD